MNPALALIPDENSTHKPCQTSDSLLMAVEDFLEAGSLFMHLREFQEFMSL
jgi:hypothetical protein